LDPNLHSHQSIQLVDQTIRRFVLLGTSTGLVVDLPKSNTWASFLMRLTNIFFLKNITRFVMFSKTSQGLSCSQQIANSMKSIAEDIVPCPDAGL